MKIEGSNVNKEIKRYLHNSAMVFIFLGMCAIFAVSSPTFLTINNILNVLRQISINGILAVGMTLVIISGGIDLSIGPLVAIAGVISALILETNPELFLLAVLAGIVSAAIMSMWTGFLVAKMSIAPFIASLSTMSVAKGLVLVISSGIPHTISNETYVKLGNGYLWDPKLTGNLALPIPVLIITIIAVITGIILYQTKFGRYIYAVGGNVSAANASGINVSRVIFFTYVLNGLLCGVAGIVLAARITSGQPTAATGYELDAITAAIIGGTSMTGGVGKIGGTLIGALIIGVLNNGLVLLGVSSYYQQIVKGVIIAIAVLLDMRSKLMRK
jgi:ribose/xylose/arabinose/galactoside ABC-type transport system permease subunit